MDITDPIIITRLNENIRPLAESLRAIKLLLQSNIDDYNSNIVPLLGKAASDDVLNDDREKEGVPFRTVGDLQEFFAFLQKVIAPGAEQWPDNVIQRFCVRILKVG